MPECEITRQEKPKANTFIIRYSAFPLPVRSKVFQISVIIVGSFHCKVILILCDAYINRCLRWNTLVDRMFHLDNHAERFALHSYLSTVSKQ